MRTLALGDVHGAARALEQVLERAHYDPSEDEIVFLGDAVDGWSDTRQVLDIFLQIPRLRWVRGNHDEWFLDGVMGQWPANEWLDQGGMATVDSYRAYPGQKFHDIAFPPEHLELAQNSVFWYEQEAQRRIFVHGGWISRIYTHPRQDTTNNLMWDRSLWERARDKQLNFDHYTHGPDKGDRPKNPVTNFAEVYIGHTATAAYSLTPVRACEVWNLDQGAGWYGRLTLMDVDTKEYWQSQDVQTLYPEVRGR